MILPRSTFLAAIAAAALAGRLQADIFIRGDSTVDGNVDISDAIATLGCLFLGQVCVDCADARDASDDGEVDLTDAICILTYSFLGGSPPSPPFPEPGVDPTADDLDCAQGLGPEGPPPIVLSEVMYHPLGEDERDEYVEIHNRGTRAVDLSGWRFSNGIDFTFPAGTSIGAGAYLVISKDADRLKTQYGIENVLGNFTLQLDDGGERIVLENATGKTIDEVRYHDDGRWPRWADGWGSSLERVSVHDDGTGAAAWAASDEWPDSSWTRFEFTATASGGSDELHLLLLMDGKCLLDDIHVLVGGRDRLSNGSFEDGKNGWKAEGTHRLSEVTEDDAVDGGASLRLVATGRGDSLVNRLETDLTAAVNGGDRVTIRGSAKWIRGSRHLLVRLWGNAAARTFVLDVPDRPGTPGATNSTAVQNRGPDIDEVTHLPVLPRATDPIKVTGLLSDIDGVASARIRYRLNSGTWTETPFVDDGTSGDLVKGDSIFTGTIPRQSAGTLVSFFVDAVDGAGARSYFPADAPDRSCLVRVGEPNPSSAFPRYHVWLPPATVAFLASGPKMGNEILDATFVLDDTDVFYNAGIRYRGSPFIRSCPPTDPVGGRYAYRIDFSETSKLKGRSELNLDNLEIGRDPTLQREHVAYYLYKELGLPCSDHQYVRLWINGSDHAVYADVEKAEETYIERHWPNDRDGYIHKVDDWFEADDDCGFSNSDAHLVNQGTDKEKYRWNFEKRSHNHDDEWSHMFDLVAKLNTSLQGAGYETAVESVIDAEQWARVLAVRRIVGDWDSLGYSRGKNAYMYFPANERRWKLMPWDMDFLLGNGDSATASLFGGIDPAINRLLEYPKYRKMYLRAFNELVYGPFQNEVLDPLMDETYTALRREYSGTADPSSIKSFIRSRRDFVMTQVPGPDLVITTNGGEDFSTSADRVTLTGRAPLEGETYRLNGAAVTLQFSGLSAWSLTRTIALGWTTFALEALDGTGTVVGSDSIRVLRVPPCVPTSVEPAEVAAGPGVEIVVRGSGFVTGSTVIARLASASEESGFSAWYAQGVGDISSIDQAIGILDDPPAETLATTHGVVNLSCTGGGELFAPTERFPAPWNVDPTWLAARYTGFIHVSSPGTRTFGVHSDDGFRLTIDGTKVSEYSAPRGPGTTLGDFDFPAAGNYLLVLEWYENGGGDLVELFQVEPSGNRLLNGGSELTVTVDDVEAIPAVTATVVSETEVRCTFDLTGATPGAWNLIITPEQGSDCSLQAAVTITP